MKSITHSKVKNTGILFELLTRQLTADILNGKKESKAVELIREHFKPTTELGKELALYRAFFSVNSLSETKALRFIDLILEQHRKINEKKLNQQKYNLVRAIKENYDIDTFLSAKVSQYKILASIYKTFLMESTEFNYDEIADAASCRFTLTEHLCTNRSEQMTDEGLTSMISEELRQTDPEVRNLAYVIMLRKFNNKYKDLNESQRLLLREYILNSPTHNSLKKFIEQQIPVIKEKLLTSALSIQDKVTQIKLQEVVVQLDTVLKGKTVKDNQVTAMMMAYQLIDELSSTSK